MQYSTKTGKFTETRMGLSWSLIAYAMNFSNVCSYIADEWKSFLAANSLTEGTGQFVPVATHSIGDRDWHIVDGREPLFFEEDGSGGWYCFVDGDVDMLYSASASSGSSLTASLDEDGTWSLTIEVPESDSNPGEPYQGSYWKSFGIEEAWLTA